MRSSPTAFSMQIGKAVMRLERLGLVAALVSAAMVAIPALAAEPRVVSLAPGPTGCPMTEAGEALESGLRNLGYAPAILDRRCFQDLAGGLRIVREIVQTKPSVLVVWGSVATAPGMKEATSTIRVVLVNAPDPVKHGLVRSFRHPGGTITGFTSMAEELAAKRVELLREGLPRVTRVGVLGNRAHPSHDEDIHATQLAARALKMDLRVYGVAGQPELAGAFGAMERDRIGAVLVLPDPLVFAHRAEIVKLAERLPGIYPLKEFVEAGGLMSYAADVGDLGRRAATYVDLILKGAKPGDLPIEQPTKFDLVINARTARVLGVALPPSLLLRASRMIE